MIGLLAWLLGKLWLIRCASLHARACYDLEQREYGAAKQGPSSLAVSSELRYGAASHTS